MQHERDVRGEGEAGPTPGAVAPAPEVTHVESVPSEQLWRAAILAARQAALSAAELRRAFEASTPAADGAAPPATS